MRAGPDRQRSGKASASQRAQNRSMGRGSAVGQSRDSRRAGEVFSMAGQNRAAFGEVRRGQRTSSARSSEDAGGSDPQTIRGRNPGPRPDPRKQAGLATSRQ